MLYPELNGPIGLSPEYKRLILPKNRTAVKVYSVRSEIFRIVFLFLSAKRPPLGKAAAPFLFSFCQRADCVYNFFPAQPLGDQPEAHTSAGKFRVVISPL